MSKNLKKSPLRISSISSRGSGVFAKNPTSTLWLVLLSIICVVQFAALGYLARQNHRQDALIVQNQETLSLAAINAMNVAMLKRVTIDPQANLVYFPEMRITLPLSDQSIRIAYMLRNDIGGKDSAATTPQEADITTLVLASFPSQLRQQFDCSSSVRIKFEATSNPYNQHETNVSSTVLADGRTLQAYASTQPECQTAYQESATDTKAIAGLFAEAKSY